MKKIIFCSLGIVVIMAFVLSLYQKSYYQENEKQIFKNVDQIVEVSEWYPQMEKVTKERQERFLEKLKDVVAVEKKEQENPYEGFWGIEMKDENGNVRELDIMSGDMFLYDGIFYETETDMYELAKDLCMETRVFQHIDQTAEVSNCSFNNVVKKVPKKRQRKFLKKLKNVIAVEKEDQENLDDGDFCTFEIKNQDIYIQKIRIISETIFWCNGQFYETETNMVELAKELFDEKEE